MTVDNAARVNNPARVKMHKTKTCFGESELDKVLIRVCVCVGKGRYGDNRESGSRSSK